MTAMRRESETYSRGRLLGGNGTVDASCVPEQLPGMIAAEGLLPEDVAAGLWVEEFQEMEDADQLLVPPPEAVFPVVDSDDWDDGDDDSFVEDEDDIDDDDDDDDDDDYDDDDDDDVDL